MKYIGFDTAAVLNAAKAKALKALGYTFSIRYLVPPGSYSKAMTKAEAEALSSAGLRIGCCWETYAKRAAAGAAAGAEDGATAKQLAEGMNIPVSAAIYFAVDYDAPKSDYPAIEAYLRAAGKACAPYRCGVYGPYAVIEEMHKRGAAEVFWQCVGWSAGKVSTHLNVYQKEPSVKTSVVTVDNNYCDDMEAAGLWTYEEKPMIYTFKPAEMGIYLNSGKKSITTIQKELGCDVICNLNLFNGNWTGACYTKADGKVVGTDGNGYYGLGFDKTGGKMARGWSTKDTHENFFGCWDVILNGEKTTAAVPAWTAGLRRRTVIGTLANGSIGIYANTSLEYPERMIQNLLNAGFTEAVCLDGGGSTQLRCPAGVVVSSDNTPRPVHTLFWANLTKKKAVCPYAEPTSNVRLLSTGNDARWVQWMLNLYGYSLSVDGIIGVKSVSAIKDFQRKHNLTADGIVGKLTREALINGR